MRLAVFAPALSLHAAAIVLAHNHPSGAVTELDWRQLMLGTSSWTPGAFATLTQLPISLVPSSSRLPAPPPGPGRSRSISRWTLKCRCRRPVTLATTTGSTRGNGNSDGGTNPASARGGHPLSAGKMVNAPPLSGATTRNARSSKVRMRVVLNRSAS
ncbi:MAG: hypothetical protein E6J41_33400, partial [Chloroflexi bacterium]